MVDWVGGNSAAGPPERDVFQPFYDYLQAADRRCDVAQGSYRSALLRAEHLAQRSFRAVQRQVARIRDADLSDPSAATQATMDAQFLIASLWLLRRAACLPAATEPHHSGPITAAIVIFDAQLPELAGLYQASLIAGLESGGIEQSLTQSRVGAHRAPEVEAISRDEYRWVGGVLGFDAALTASGFLTLELRAALLRMQ